MGMDVVLPGQEWLTHPDIPRMVELAVKRKLRMFNKYNDLDFDSLYADAMGSLVTAKYDPTQSKPGTFAYQVAWRRLMDISKQRTHEAKKQAEGREAGVFKRAFTDFDDPETELAEIARRIYVTTQAYCTQNQVPVQTGPGRPTLTFAQKSALTMLQRQMGWSFRDTEAMTKRYPGILEAVGVTQSKSRQFFYSAAKTVTKFARKQKKILGDNFVISDN